MIISKFWIIGIVSIVIIAMIGPVSSILVAQNKINPEKMSNLQMEKRAQKLQGDIMAPCCFGGTLNQHAESALTVEMKARIRTFLKQGMTDKQVVDAMVEYYGKKMGLPKNQWERIRATPEAKGINLLVWILPILALFLGALFVYWILKRFVNQNQNNKPNNPQIPTKDTNAISPEMSKRIEDKLTGYHY